MNKNIFITGGTSGIGKALINHFVKNNYNIFFTYFKNLRKAKSISKDLKEINVRHGYAKMDLGKMNSINNAFKKFSKKFKNFDIFINNASPEIRRKRFLQLENKDIFKNLNTLLVGNIATIKKALEHSLRKKNDSQIIIINISSYSAVSGGKNIHLYAASKAALNTLSIALSKDKYKKKIRIISIIPRYIDTPTFRKNNNIKNEKDLNNFKRLKKIKTIKSSNDFAKFIYKKIVMSKYSKKPIVHYHTT